jgi:peptidoglycan-associated lipoprotein
MGTLTRGKYSFVVLALAMTMFGVGCKKKTPIATPPPAPPPAPVARPARPVIAQFEAEPGTIERGQAATLRWNVTGEVTSITIDQGVGTVNANGNRSVYPGSSVTYTLTATGPGGDAKNTASVNVTAPVEASVTPPKSAPARSFQDIVSQDLQDAYFDYDQSSINESARSVLTRNADVLKGLFSQFPGGSVIVEGHADERGSAEYNLGLSDRRATSAREFLQQLGVPVERLRVVARGKESPSCTDANESCWAKNRRAHFVAQP